LYPLGSGSWKRLSLFFAKGYNLRAIGVQDDSMANGGALDILAAGDFNDPRIQAVTISVWGARLIHNGRFPQPALPTEVWSKKFHLICANPM
tara:strand:- start:251 stop:526 length:276 start_codon:yes stop_codon:yes gene_type:complete